VRRQPTVAEGVVLAGGLLTAVASFLPFAELSGRTWTAWAPQAFLFPLSTLPALLAVLAVVVDGAPVVGAKLPDRLAGFEPDQLVAGAASAAALLMLAWLAVDKGGGGLAAGGVLMLVGSVAMATGAVGRLLGRGNRILGPGGGRRPSLRVIRGERDQAEGPSG
jgi:hypothetical protein